jgi:hypothetical protein
LSTRAESWHGSPSVRHWARSGASVPRMPRADAGTRTPNPFIARHGGAGPAASGCNDLQARHAVGAHARWPSWRPPRGIRASRRLPRGLVRPSEASHEPRRCKFRPRRPALAFEVVSSGRTRPRRPRAHAEQGRRRRRSVAAQPGGAGPADRSASHRVPSRA